MPNLIDVRKALNSLSGSKDVKKLEGMDVTILFDTKGDTGGLWTVDVDDGEISIEEGEVGSPDVTVEATSEDLVALMKGDLNPMAAFMQGRLKVKGDMSVAMQIQKLFT
ncbi:MAG: SCP2 sterol-binding domain-containing protein [Anaerolineae bacterium]|jgi:putative sterol carrier protein